jgi:hypothetical protein
MTLLPRLVNLLGKRTIHARLRFAAPRTAAADRKQLARRLRAEIVRLQETR